MENQAKSPLDVAEIVGVIASIAGAIAAPITQQIALASIPLSATLALNLLNRKRLLQLLEEQIDRGKENIEKLQDLIETSKTQTESVIKNSTEEIKQKITAVEQQLTSDLNNNKQELGDNLQKLESKQNNLEQIVCNLKEIENLSQALRVNPDSAEFYYQRGVRHQRLGDKQGAIEDYTAAINLNSKYAQAYHNRGVLSLEIGDRKRAVDDLRKAARLYFEQGDIESYQQARDISHKVHDLRKDMDLKNLVVGGLFS